MNHTPAYAAGIRYADAVWPTLQHVQRLDVDDIVEVKGRSILQTAGLPDSPTNIENLRWGLFSRFLDLLQPEAAQ